MNEKTTTIILKESELIALLYAAAQQSCGYDKNQIEDNLWHLHCCDYNEPIYKVVKQIDLDQVEDVDCRGWLEKITEKSKGYYEELEE